MQETQRIIYQIRARGNAIIDPVSGAELYTPIEDIKGSYVYELFPPLTEEEINSLKQTYNRQLPSEMLDFLRLTNGGNFFGRYIRISGMPYSPLHFQNCKIPDILWRTDSHRTKNTPKEWLFFATYKNWKTYGQAHVCIDCSISGSQKPVYCLPYNGDEILMRWDSFEQWFCSEFNRFNTRFANGEYIIYDIVQGVLKGIHFPE